MTGAVDPLATQLAALKSRNRLRSLIPRAGRDFASNDYLGLATDPRIAQAVVEAVARGVPVGSGGSRLLRGNDPEHEALEEKAAHFFHSEAALFFANGFAANSGLVACLPQRGDLIVADELVHASAHDGLKLTKAAYVFARHNDPQSVEDLISGWHAEGGKGRIWLLFETLYSMDGDIAPVDVFAEIAARHDAMLLIDEAHGTGVFGPQGRGLAAQWDGRLNVVTLHTCGKGMGTEGALVTGSRLVIDYLINRARPFIFSTSPSPLMAVAASAALDCVAQADDLRARLGALRAHAAEKICRRFGLPVAQSQIIPIILGDDRRTMAAAAQLQEAGFDVRGVRPPTVPAGTSRLRVSLTLNVDSADIDALSDALGPILA